jgi:hypothetical protein
VWNFVSSSRLWPSVIRIMAMSARTSLSPTTRSHPTPLDRRLAFQLHTEFGEERFGSLEVVYNDEKDPDHGSAAVFAPERTGTWLRLGEERPMVQSADVRATPSAGCAWRSELTAPPVLTPLHRNSVRTFRK